MKNYSDPVVWAAYLRERKLEVVEPPPPSPEYYQWLTGENVQIALDAWARTYCKRHRREMLHLAFQAQATLARNYMD